MQPSLFARSVRNTFLKRRPVLRSVSTTSRLSKDPWPLPHTPEHLASTVTPTDLPPPEPLSRSNESIETTRARLIYQSRKRGTLESDLLLSTFAQEKLSAMGASELHEYDKLLDEPDWDIYYWATGKRTPPERWASSSVLENLKVHARNEGKAVRRMPDLH
ncbi:hypothetical protein HETIRDRAFT_325273 [Heterobasidion irregulare TC 32-1]|uniref:Succinate dehydrogenase assembly factor 2, mitochondrial n=1 Tax=Heterobasidion irregulare (strain TC 32-1) TaxID=747525 RepID=W4JWU0_HETIT|nr:uncharacterized protein HETIRDRAFT_325273 [Heterobasidion irregulare TC 32-1]ETW78027.1 hypothetical protein HETIRDRAFT_325273 [Heterobasidion irregulare TC 32-1]